MHPPRWRRWLASGVAIAALGGAGLATGTAVAGPVGAQAGSDQVGQAPAQATTSSTPAETSTTETTSASSTSSSTGSSTTAAPATTTTAAPATTTTEEETVETSPPATDEVVDEETTTTTRRRATTTTGTATTRGPQSSVVAPTTTTSAPTTTSGSSREQRVVWLVVGLLCVVGLLIGTLTWRYWWFTNPRRGYARSRAILNHRQLRDDADSEVVTVWEDGQEVPPPDVPVPGSPVAHDPDTLPTGMRAIRPPGERELGEWDEDR